MALFALIVSQISRAGAVLHGFYGFFGQGELSRTADALSDLVRVELVNSRLMTVIDSIIVGQSLAEMENLTQASRTEDALETARQLSADFLLIGRGPLSARFPSRGGDGERPDRIGQPRQDLHHRRRQDRRTADTIAKEVVNAMIVLEAVTLGMSIPSSRSADTGSAALLERFRDPSREGRPLPGHPGTINREWQALLQRPRSTSPRISSTKRSSRSTGGFLRTRQSSLQGLVKRVVSEESFRQEEDPGSSKPSLV
jgi:hypothetical protein